MARKRFSDLERIYDALNTANANWSSLPANVDFVKYGKWRRGEAPAVTIVRPALNGENEIGITAFGLPDTNSASKILVTITGRSHTKANSEANKALFGHAASLAGYATNLSFIPAKLHLSTLGAGVSETSRITGRRYKKRGTGAYTIPIGQNGTNKHYQEAVSAIITAYAPEPPATATTSVSFSPEEWRRD